VIQDKTNEEAGTSLTPNRQDLLDRIRLRSLIVVNLRPTGSQVKSPDLYM